MILTGVARIGRDAELRHTPSGHAVADLSLVFNYGKKGADGFRPSQWISASLWGKRAESLVQYLTKGQMVSVVLNEPRIETYETRDGRAGAKLVADVMDLEFAGGKREDGAAAPRPAPAAAAPNPIDDMDSDIPF
jgi:single-strand DNA-binding protein